MNYKGLPYYKNVLRGMAWLDANAPGWLGNVDLDSLNMEFTKRDAFSQATNAALKHSISTDDMFYGRGRDRIKTNANSLEYRSLTNTWRELIKLRRSLPPIPEGMVFVGNGPLDSFGDNFYGLLDTNVWREGHLGNHPGLLYCAPTSHPAVEQWLFEGEPVPVKREEAGQSEEDGHLQKILKALKEARDSAFEEGRQLRHNFQEETDWLLDEIDHCRAEKLALISEIKTPRREWTLPEEPTFKPGQRFIYKNGDEYILASTGAGNCLISLVKGNYWSGPHEVEINFATRLSEVASGHEFDFTPID